MSEEKRNECGLFPYTVKETMGVQAAGDQPGWNITAFNLPEAWEKTQGEGVAIHVLDSTPGYSPIICKNKDKNVLVLSMEEIFEKYSNGDILRTEKGEEVVRVTDLKVWTGRRKEGSYWQKIKLAIRHHYDGELLRINTRGGMVDITPNHSVFGINGTTVDAKTLSPGHKICLSSLNKIKNTEGSFFIGNEDLAWFLGMWSAEGSVFSLKKQPYVVTISNARREILEKCQLIATNVFNVHSCIGEHEGMCKLWISNRGMYKWFKKHCVSFTNEKRVPTCILNAPSNIKNSFLQGYNLGDGHHTTNKRLSWEFSSFTSKSQLLLSGLIYLIHCLGEQKYTLQTRDDKDAIQLTLNKPNSQKHLTDRREITKIISLNYQGMVYDLETEDHSFGCGVGLVRLHNTGCDLDHPDLRENIQGGKNFINTRKDPWDDNMHGCINGDALIYTSYCGIEKIRNLYNKLPLDELMPEHGGPYDRVKDVRSWGIKTKSLNTENGETEIDTVDFVHKTKVNENIIKISLDGNITLKLTPWHPVYLAMPNNHGKNKIYKKRADEINPGERMFSPGKIPIAKEMQRAYGHEYKQCLECGHIPAHYKIKNSKCKKCFKTNWNFDRQQYFINNDLAYLLGVILTDGHLTDPKNKQYRVEIHSQTKEIHTKCQISLKNLGFKFKFRNEKVGNTYLDSREFHSIVRSLGIKHGSEKTYRQNLPSLISKSPLSVICAFIAGVIDGDGCINKSNTNNRVSTASLQFATEFCALMNSVGMRCGISKDKNYLKGTKKINKDCPWMYQCLFSILHQDVKNHIVHPIKLKRSNKKTKSRKIRRIKKIEKMSVNEFFYDFTVRKNHTYVANGHFISNTHCCGIIASPKNGLGIIGVAPKSKVTPVKVLDASGNGNMVTVANGIRWSADHGANIISMSLGGPFKVQELRKSIQYAHQKGIPIFCAAGNAGRTEDIFYPARYPETIAIGSIDENFKRSNFSNTGPNLDFMAPGGDILSCVPDNWYAILSGTSMACPFAVGVAALLLSYKLHNKDADFELNTVEEYREQLKRYTIPTSDKKYGGDKFFQGFGIIDPRKFSKWLKQSGK